MEKTLTIGIPAYNVEEFLAQCLDSLLRDDLVRDLEVLVVDDGSRDGTGRIAEEYERRFPGTVRLISKQNGGWGSAVNVAIREARGKYFKNLDSDDMFDADGLRALVMAMKEQQADVVISRSLSWNQATGSVVGTPIPREVTYGRLLQMDELLGSVRSDFWMHTLAFRTALLQENGVTVDECFYTDTELATYPLVYAKTAYAIPEPVYIYRTGRVGQSMSVPSLAKHLPDRERVTRSILGKFASEEWKNVLPGTRSYLAYVARLSVYSLIKQPLAVTDAAARDEWVAKLSAFKHETVDPNPELNDYRGYLQPARFLLENDFRHYAAIARLWRFAKTRLAPVANSLISLAKGHMQHIKYTGK